MDDDAKKSVVPASTMPTSSVASDFYQSVRHADSDTAFDVLTVAAKVVTSPKEAAFSALRLIRAATAHRFTEQLRAEWAKYVEEGKIKADYAGTDQAQTIFADTLESLGEANFDAEQLDLLRRLFLAAASESQTDRDNLLVREYIAVGRTLSAGEIRVLSAYYHYLPEWTANSGRSSSGTMHLFTMQELLDVLQERTGLKHRTLLERFDKSLGHKGLARSAGPMTGSQAVDPRLFRLTDFGFAFCEFLQSYETLKQPSASDPNSQ
jgi:hypothetical protein